MLKNQYARIERPRKEELLAEVFSGPLRALHWFFEGFEKNPEQLVSSIEAAIKERGKEGDEQARQKLAKRVVAGLVQLLALGFLLKTAQSVSSESLIEDVRKVAESNGTLAFRLIELGVVLDSPKALPRGMLKQLIEQSGTDIVSVRLIQAMVINRLYMFKSSEQDKQWLSKELRLGLRYQHAVDVKAGPRRRLR